MNLSEALLAKLWPPREDFSLEMEDIVLTVNPGCAIDIADLDAPDQLADLLGIRLCYLVYAVGPDSVRALVPTHDVHGLAKHHRTNSCPKSPVPPPLPVLHVHEVRQFPSIARQTLQESQRSVPGAFVWGPPLSCYKKNNLVLRSVLVGRMPMPACAG